MCGLPSNGEEQVASGLVKEMQDRVEGQAGDSTSKSGEAQSEKADMQWVLGARIVYTKSARQGNVFLCHTDIGVPPLAPILQFPQQLHDGLGGLFLFCSPMLNHLRCPVPPTWTQLPCINRGRVIWWGPGNLPLTSQNENYGAGCFRHVAASASGWT